MINTITETSLTHANPKSKVKSQKSKVKSQKTKVKRQKAKAKKSKSGSQKVGIRKSKSHWCYIHL